MADIGTLIMRINADTSNYDRGMSSIKSGLTSTAKVAGVAMLAVGSAMAVGGVKALKNAAHFEEARNKYDVVFNGMTDTVDDWAKNFSEKVGRSKYATQESIANLADLQQGLGMTKEASFDLSSKIVELGTDLASFNNVQDEDAINAISKAMLGEADSAKQLGLLLNVERVKEYVESQGLVYEKLTDAERAQQVYNLAVSQSQNAIGDAERSNNSFTNQMKRLNSSLTDASKDIGDQLLPTVTALVTFINDKIIPAVKRMIDIAIENFPAVQEKAKIMFEGIVEFGMVLWNFFEENLLPILKFLFNWVKENFPAIKMIFTDVFNAMIAIVKAVWTILDATLIPILKVVFNFIVDNWGTIATVFKTTFDVVITIIDGVIGAFKTLIDWIKSAYDWLTKFFGAKDGGDMSVPTPAEPVGQTSVSNRITGNRANGGYVRAGESYIVGERGHEVFTPSTSGMISSSKNITININGNQDPNVIADQIVQTLRMQGVA